MRRIHLLDDSLINKIAAGEVVERPASVLKELVENALDSGAKHISIELEEGGIEKISVSDDGRGISADDLPFTVIRHATSKISSVQDLFSVESLGFRGEALASIAAVSEFSLVSREESAQEGARLFYSSQTQAFDVESAAMEIGTRAIVRHLFANLPARKRFLKSPQTELAYCMEFVQAIALARPEVGFRLVHNKKQRLHVPPQAEGLGDEWSKQTQSALNSRFLEVIGEKNGIELQPFIHESDYGKVWGLASPPGYERATTKHIFTFVNRRWVKDKLLRFAVSRGYHSHMLKGKHPVLLLNFECDPSLVDVNCHPAKTEVRFQYRNEVQDLIVLGIREALRNAKWALAPKNAKIEAHSLAEGDAPKAFQSEISSKPFASIASSKPFPTVSGLNRKELLHPPQEEVLQAIEDRLSRPFPMTKPPKKSFSYSLDSESKILEETNSQLLSSPIHSIGLSEGVVSEMTLENFAEESIPWAEVDFIGSFADCYLLFECHKKLLVVDQHAFHERIIYERLLKDPKLTRTSQPLMIPESFQLSFTEVDLLKKQSSFLSEFGLQLSFIGEQTVEISSVPSILSGKDLNHLLGDILKHKDGKGEELHADLHHLTLATIACHSAVRSGEKLGESELRVLLAEANQVNFYHNCPHGRRVFRWFSGRQVGGWFDRG